MFAVRTVALVVLASWFASAQAAEITLNTADGKAVSASHQGKGERGVVLVHDANRSQADWVNFAGRLSSNGFSVVSVDLRGHGGSKSVADPVGEADWPLMVAEVDAAAAYLKGHGSTSVAVLGAGLGANLGLAAATQNDAIGNVVMLSPGWNVQGVRIGEAILAYQGPMLIVADSKDAGANRTAVLMGDKAKNARVELVAAGTSGHRMLNTVTALEATLVGWLNGAQGEGAQLARPDRTLRTDAPTGIETTGTNYGDKP